MHIFVFVFFSTIFLSITPPDLLERGGRRGEVGRGGMKGGAVGEGDGIGGGKQM
jgi:hypothetical protein